MPCLRAYEDRNSLDRETNSCVIGTCLVSTASTAEDLVKPDTTRGLMSLFFEHRRDEAPVVLTKYARIPVRGVTKLVLSPIAFDSTLESCVRAEKRHACVGCVTTSGSYVGKISVSTADNSRGFTMALDTVVVPDAGEDVQRLYATGRDGEFYAIRRTPGVVADASVIRYDGRLYLASFDTSASFGSFSFTQVGPDSCTPTELAVSKNGRYLYYLVNKEGKTGQPVDTATLSLGTDTLVAGDADPDSQAMPYDLDAVGDQLAASPPAQTESGGLLAPGMTMTYRMSFAIPDGWSGEKKLRAGIDNNATTIIQPEFVATALDADSGQNSPFDGMYDEDAEWLAFLLALVLAPYGDPYDDFNLNENDQPKAEVSIVDGQTYANHGDLIALGESDQTSKKVDPAGGDQPRFSGQRERRRFREGPPRHQ